MLRMDGTFYFTVMPISSKLMVSHLKAKPSNAPGHVVVDGQNSGIFVTRLVSDLGYAASVSSVDIFFPNPKRRLGGASPYNGC